MVVLYSVIGAVIFLHGLALASHGASTTDLPALPIPDADPAMDLIVPRPRSWWCVGWRPQPGRQRYRDIRELLWSQSVNDVRTACVAMMSSADNLSVPDHHALIVTLLDRTVGDPQLLRYLPVILSRTPSAVLAVNNSSALHRLYDGGIRPLLTGPRPPLSYDSHLYLAWSELLRRCPLRAADSAAVRASEDLNSLHWAWAFFDVFARRWDATSTPNRSRYKITVALRDTVRRLLNADRETFVLDQYVGDLLIEFVLRTVPQSDYVNSMISRELDWKDQLACASMSTTACHALRRQFDYWLGIGKIRNQRMLWHLEADSLRGSVRALVASHRSAPDRNPNPEDCGISIHVSYGKLYYELMEVAHPCSSDLFIDPDLARNPLAWHVQIDASRIAEALAYWLVHVEEFSTVVSPLGPEAFRRGSAALSGLLRVANLPDQDVSDLERCRRRIYYDLVAGGAIRIHGGGALIPELVRARHWRATPLDFAVLARCVRARYASEVDWSSLMAALLGQAEFRAQLVRGATPQAYLDLLGWIYVHLSDEHMAQIRLRYPHHTFAFVPSWMVPILIKQANPNLLIKVRKAAGFLCGHCHHELVPLNATTVEAIRQCIETNPIVSLPNCDHILHLVCVRQLRRSTPSYQALKCPTCQAVVHQIESMMQ